LDVELTTLSKTVQFHLFYKQKTFRSEVSDMPLFFLIPLCTALVTGYLFKKSTDEIAYLAGMFTVISLILSLVLAPWQIQLGLLIIVLIMTNRLLQENKSQ
jgi:hypothetical protein